MIKSTVTNPRMYFDLVRRLPKADELPVGYRKLLSETNPNSLLLPPLCFECEVVLIEPQKTQLHYVYSPNGSSPTEKLGETITPEKKAWLIQLLAFEEE